MRVVEKWILYRLKNPRGRPASSPLDMINATTWNQPLDDDLLNLLHVLREVVRLDPRKTPFSWMPAEARSSTSCNSAMQAYSPS